VVLPRAPGFQVDELGLGGEPDLLAEVAGAPAQVEVLPVEPGQLREAPETLPRLAADEHGHGARGGDLARDGMVPAPPPARLPAVGDEPREAGGEGERHAGVLMGTVCRWSVRSSFRIRATTMPTEASPREATSAGTLPGRWTNASLFTNR